MSEDKPDESYSDAVSSLWARGDGPLPSDIDQLVTEIKGLAAARQQDARTHRPFCTCDGCRLRRQRQDRFFRNHAA